MHDPDARLVELTKDGDTDAFEELVKRYQRQVLSTAYRYVGDASAAEDLAQEVFIKVWEKAGAFKGRSRFSTWLYRIVVNHCLNYQDKRKRRRTVDLDERIADNAEGVQERIERNRKVQIVRDAVSRLPERQRIALILSRFEGHSYAEIARIMKTSLSSVESLIFRAKDNLKKTLSPLREKQIV
ncbi:sigma-70 family RNA polymerase sigma factor [candidate division WOR-3 bacterium]|uniref:RNA polymerase sigma factor n=1 Tax=candidate division WOR-3 bacterium TaxID=2052148 RepID=A0A9D5K7X9_UNCW3|nr:sigma-70 family RNA polymerase sigma factor [candidate division WOR-3 bacterium]MBD3364021.1 sigma-70 family RNA polymerase sigma factor [candidate division WOR-3 bacterium]